MCTSIPINVTKMLPHEQLWSIIFGKSGKEEFFKGVSEI